MQNHLNTLPPQLPVPLQVYQNLIWWANRRTILMGIKIPIITIRWSSYLYTRNPILVKRHLYFGVTPWAYWILATILAEWLGNWNHCAMPCGLHTLRVLYTSAWDPCINNLFKSNPKTINDDSKFDENTIKPFRTCECGTMCLNPRTERNGS